MNKTESTHFGFQTVPWEDKEKKVREVFAHVAHNYDIMNDVMSLGIHHLWKKTTIALSHIRKGHHILDLAGGSGDLTKLMSRRVGETGRVVLADINSAMLNVGRDRLINEGLVKNIDYVQANAENLPFKDNTFHTITMAFGLRNVTDKAKALRSMARVCKPGGQVMILEFSTPTIPLLKPIYDWYSFHILPKMGQWIADDAESYQYLAESIRMHPDQETLKTLIETSGFEDCQYFNFSGGIVALHVAHKY